jgi:hypothetical protein
MPKRLAITVAGAVSLGDYEAGVMYEILQAISQHNQDPRTSPDNQIVIDVFTGASAGAMTVTIAAQKLLYDGTALSGVRSNALYTPWVRDISLAALLTMQSGDDDTKSILSSQLIEQISQRYITQRYQSGIAPARRPHPACANKVYVGLALSNLNGIDYSIPLQSGDPDFTYTRFQDEFIRYFSLNDPSQDSLPVWEAMRNAAVASGAFPFAFAVKKLIRHPEEYTDPGYSLTAPSAFPATNGEYAYTDGGVFQNEPLGLAKNLVDKIDDHRHVDSRFYLFVAPGGKASCKDNTFSAADANFYNTLKTLGNAIFQQARFHDWITAEDLNIKIRTLNDRAAGLASALMAGTVKAADLNPASAALLPLLFPTDADFDDESPDSARDRLRHQYSDEFTMLTKGPAGAAAAFIDAILTLEKSANLENHEEMVIYGITASDDELAGDPLFAFLGFFDQKYRDHDYDLGRQKARDFIDRLNVAAAAPGAKTPSLGPINHAPWPDQIVIDPALGKATVTDLSESLRKQFKTQLNDRAFTLTTELGMPWAVREGVEDFFTLPHLNKLLGL